MNYNLKHKGMITLCIMLATIMEIIDSTIANVALPHMQGSLGASQDQISWVLTSYIVSAAITMPLTSWLVNVFGTRNLLLICTTGFTFASMLCGLATSINQMVLYRLIQGVLGASLVPLSQSILFEINPPEKHGQAMATWGMGIMFAPIVGPMLGGYITEHYSWRWIFFINLPVGILASVGIATFLPKSEVIKKAFDIKGFILFSTFIATLQLMLDRGELVDWFESKEILLYCFVSIVTFITSILYSMKKSDPFVPVDIFKDRNFSVSTILMFCVGMILFASIVIMPQFLQLILGYNVFDAGLLTAPRGVGVLISMGVAGKLVGKLDIRSLIIFGITCIATTMYLSSGFNFDVTKLHVSLVGLVQGFGFGFIFVPISSVSLATLPSSLRTQATSMSSLIRNIGSSVGISMIIFFIGYNVKFNHAILVENARQNNKNINHYAAKIPGAEDGSVLYLEGEIMRQSGLMGYLNAFKLSMFAALFMIPLILFLKPVKIAPGTKVDLH